MATLTAPKAQHLFSHRQYWAARLTPAPVLPVSRAEMDALGWDECDVIIVTGDAYVDHPSFGMALIGRVLEAQGFRVGIIAQPDWRSTRDFERLGRPRLFFGVTAGNMDSMVNRYTAARRRRRSPARSLGDRLQPASARGLPRRAARARRHRSEPAADRALRLLAGEGAPLRAARCESGPARVRQRRAADRRDRASARGRRADRCDSRRARHGVRRVARSARLDRDRLDGYRHARPDRQAARPLC